MVINPEAAPLRQPVGREIQRDRLGDWLAWQETLHFTDIEMGLGRCAEVAGRMGLLRPDFVVISVAGTNGKGSSVAMLDAILGGCGYKVGSYTSPHLSRYNERIKIDGLEVDDDALCQSFVRIERVRGDISLTYFEFGTLAAMDIFHGAGVDVALLEVGLGGRLDAVNCFDADVALISSIDLDHQQWLGNDRESIGREKAGIFRGGRPAICADPHPPGAVLKYAESIGAELYIPGRDFNYRVSGDSWCWQWDTLGYDNLPCPDRHNSCQAQNAAGVLMALRVIEEKLPLRPGAIEQGLRNFKLIGRFQVLSTVSQIVLDVAHNVQAAGMLAHNLKQFPISGKTHVVIGMLKDKDCKGFLSKLLGVGDCWHAVSLRPPRGNDSAALRDALAALGITEHVSEHDNFAGALSKLEHETARHDRIVVTGSFLSVGDAINHLGPGQVTLG